ncbi:hypothetical protein HHK36_032927 [Tetracentron sinense]|uniref:Retrotransposon Copia-like N-terminal domain-containing protein n=1 Tax=Tetracentron sinense TaxID=13715 RepID=A0A834Y7B3_TETSI|nr:hypothetical protein HHK36_032927 [Tetracentron sinense]
MDCITMASGDGDKDGAPSSLKSTLGLEIETTLNNPFYLPHSDNPGTILVSHPLNGDNYPTWSRAMHTALTAKNKFGFVDGSFLKPKDSSSSLASWERCNSMVLSWLCNAMMKDISDSVSYANTAHEVWTDLCDRFSQSNAPRIFQLKNLIATHLQEQQSVASFFTKLKQYWDELGSLMPIASCSCGASKSLVAHQQKETLMQFFMGLNASYGPIRSQILLLDPLPSVAKAYSLVLQEQRQRELNIVPTTNDITALATQRPTETRVSQRKNMQCDY